MYTLWRAAERGLLDISFKKSKKSSKLMFHNIKKHLSISFKGSQIHQIDSSTIDGNVEFVCTLSRQFVTSVNSVFVSDKIINNSDNFRIKCFSYSKISAILCVL